MDPREYQILLATTQITCSWINGRPDISPTDVTDFLRQVRGALGRQSSATEAVVPPRILTPKEMKDSITAEYLISFEDGKSYRTLKRHLARHGLTAEQYRAKWGLPDNYPITAPAYSLRRSEMAKAIGLGVKK